MVIVFEKDLPNITKGFCARAFAKAKALRTKAPTPSKIQAILPFRELKALPRFGLTVFLTFHNPRITGQKPSRL